MPSQLPKCSLAPFWTLPTAPTYLNESVASIHLNQTPTAICSTTRTNLDPARVAATAEISIARLFASGDAYLCVRLLFERRDAHSLSLTRAVVKHAAARSRHPVAAHLRAPQVICFIAPVKDIDVQLASQVFIGAGCSVLLRRLPPDLFNGTYLVPAAAIEVCAESKVTELIEAEWLRAPARLDVAFNMERADLSFNIIRSEGPVKEVRIRANVNLPPVS